MFVYCPLLKFLKRAYIFHFFVNMVEHLGSHLGDASHGVTLCRDDHDFKECTKASAAAWVVCCFTPCVSKGLCAELQKVSVHETVYNCCVYICVYKVYIKLLS